MMEADKKTVILPMDQLIGLVQLQLSEKGSASLVVTGNSMLPIFRHMRDRVLLAPPENFKKGDIILYRRDDGKYVLHRILKKKDGYVICSGDNQWVMERVEDTWVLAVVTGFYKHSKQIHKRKRQINIFTTFLIKNEGIILIIKPLFINSFTTFD